MSFSMRLLVLWSMVALAGAVGAQGQAAAGARIVNVQTTTVVARAQSTFNGLEGRRLPKFAPEGRPLTHAVLTVNWQIARPLPDDVVVRFSYRTASSDMVRIKEQRVAGSARGNRQTRFAVPLEQIQIDRVSSWRVQLLNRGAMLDQKLSASWR